jgi:predicted metalloprotease
VRWKKVPGQGDMEDRRGQSGGPLGGGGFPIPMGAGGGGLGLIILVVLALLFGGNIVGGGGSSGPLNPGGIDETVPQADSGTQPGTQTGTTKDQAFEFAKFVIQDAQDMWTQIFQQSGKAYTRAPVVTFTSGTVTGCGPASSSTGPFYCPVDHKVYLDLSFFRELSQRFGAPGDFATAYVIAHEIGHHIQSELGIEEQIRQKQQDDPSHANRYSVQLELQADCFAGVWARSTYDRGILDPGDIDEGLKAAAAVGDDRLGARSREQWTHGSSELRVQWFRTGFDSGKPGDCDTSNVDV